MEYVVGFTLAVLFCAATAWLGMDRERVFYPAVVMAVASYYLAFAVVDGRGDVMMQEVMIASVFIGAAVLGFKRNPWWAVVALGAHGVMDVFHAHWVDNAGVPQSWPGFCAMFDVVAALCVTGVRLRRARRHPRPPADASCDRSHRGQKNAIVRTSMLSRCGAPVRRVGSTKALWPLKRARPSVLESQVFSSST